MCDRTEDIRYVPMCGVPSKLENQQHQQLPLKPSVLVSKKNKGFLSSMSQYSISSTEGCHKFDCDKKV